jgi:hypothetical protein
MQQAIAAQQWHGLMALGKTRRVPAALLSLTPPQSKQWGHMAPCLRPHRWLQWHTMRTTTHGTKRKRRELRTRDTIG